MSEIKNYFNPAGFKLVFGRKGGPQWTLLKDSHVTGDRTFVITYTVPAVVKDGKEVTKEVGISYSFDNNEFLNLGAAISNFQLPMLEQAESCFMLREKTNEIVQLMLMPAPIQEGSTQAPELRPVLCDPKKPENNLPIPNPIAQSISVLVDNLSDKH